MKKTNAFGFHEEQNAELSTTVKAAVALKHQLFKVRFFLFKITAQKTMLIGPMQPIYKVRLELGYNSALNVGIARSTFFTRPCNTFPGPTSVNELAPS